MWSFTEEVQPEPNEGEWDEQGFRIANAYSSDTDSDEEEEEDGVPDGDDADEEYE